MTTTWRSAPRSPRRRVRRPCLPGQGRSADVDEPRVLSVTHYSPMMGQPDEPENYHTLVYTLTANGGVTGHPPRPTQDGNDSEEQAEQFSENWQGCSTASRPRSRR